MLSKLNLLIRKVAAVDGKVDAVDGKVDAVDGKVGLLEGALTLLKGRVAPRFSPEKLEEMQSSMFLVYAEVNGFFVILCHPALYCRVWPFTLNGLL